MAIPAGTAPATALQALDDAGRAGMRLVQIRAEWPRIQPTPAQWEFAWLDALVARAQARNLPVVLVLGPAPRWAVSYLPKPTDVEVGRSRPDLPAYRRYAAAVAARYAGRVTHYQLWERPHAGRLLTTEGEIRKLFRAGAEAIHGADPKAKVIAPEPGNVHLRWLHDYLAAVRGASRADVVLLAPAPDLPADTLAWRLAVLRQRVLAQPAPELWGSTAIASGQAGGWTAAATLLLHDVSTVLLEPSIVRDLSTKPSFMAELQALSSLSGYACLGWQRVGPATAAVFGLRGAQRAVILPDSPCEAGATVRLVPSAEPVEDGIAVPGGRLEVRRLSDAAHSVDVTDETIFTLAERPLIMGGVLLVPAAGQPPAAPAPVPAVNACFDPTSADRRAIRPLPNLPGGCYLRKSLIWGTGLETVRNEQPWIYLDVPDGFLFFNVERQPVEVTLRVRGAWEARRTGFSLYYDAVDGMAYTRWQWIDVGPATTHTYTFRLDDALFANSEGYDLRLDMGGSDEGVCLLDVTVRRVPPP